MPPDPSFPGLVPVRPVRLHHWLAARPSLDHRLEQVRPTPWEVDQPGRRCRKDWLRNPELPVVVRPGMLLVVLLEVLLQNFVVVRQSLVAVRQKLQVLPENFVAEERTLPKKAFLDID